MASYNSGAGQLRDRIKVPIARTRGNIYSVVANEPDHDPVIARLPTPKSVSNIQRRNKPL